MWSVLPFEAVTELSADVTGAMLQTLLVGFAVMAVVCAWIKFLPYHEGENGMIWSCSRQAK